MKKKLCVWCLSDGRPGHFNQTKGLVQTLEKGFDIELFWIDVRLRAKPLRKLLRGLLNTNSQFFSSLICKLYQYELPTRHPDLIVSTGGNTAYLNIALATRFHCENYFIGSLRGLKAGLFSKVFTIEPTGSDNNILMPLAPVPFNREGLKDAGAALKQQHHKPLWALLIGGSTREYLYSENDWASLAEKMNLLADQCSIQWLVTTSRRTGAHVEQILADGLHKDTLADATWYSQQPRKVMMSYLGAADRVFCTEDSLSMLTEAIYSSKPATSIFPFDHKPEQRYEAAISRLVERGWLQRCQINKLDVRIEGQDSGLRADPADELWRLIEISGLHGLSKSDDNF
ncbi:MAG: ELM1/GtrOC1 family putative glycosyltransferase [Pontibacterium sp.]